MHIASIIHITDTHLFVDEHGVTRPASDRAWLVRALARVGVGDLDFAAAEMTEQLQNTLRRAVDLERSIMPETGLVVAVHTGDTEAFGSSASGPSYAGFKHLSRVFADADLGDAAVAVYGNHDLWPGSISLFGLNGPRHDPQKRTLAETVEVVGNLPPVTPIRFSTGGDSDVVFVPINSVNSHALRGGILAYGRLSHHPPSPASVFDLVRSYELRPEDLNVAVMHHPPHFYRPLTLRDRLGIGCLDDAENVAFQLADAGIDLVLAGHRHRLDPAFGTAVDATKAEQSPLPPGMAQLVAISPTILTDAAAARHDPTGSPRSGLCVYRVVAAAGSTTLHRVIHPTEPGWGVEPIVESETITGLATQRAMSTEPTV